MQCCYFVGRRNCDFFYKCRNSWAYVAQKRSPANPISTTVKIDTSALEAVQINTVTVDANFGGFRLQAKTKTSLYVILSLMRGGLPDFYRCNIPKTEKYTKWP
jgi:hypothetical protein